MQTRNCPGACGHRAKLDGAQATLAQCLAPRGTGRWFLVCSPPPTMWHLLGMGVPGRHPSLLVAGVFAVGKGPAGEGG